MIITRRTATKKISVPGANAWIERVEIPHDNPHKLLVIAKSGPGQPSHRELRAKLFMLAAECERRTESRYKWIINVDGIAHYGAGQKAMSLHIELSDESMHEFYAAEGLIQDLASDLVRDALFI